jgi:hypothetical protein
MRPHECATVVGKFHKVLLKSRKTALYLLTVMGKSAHE